MTKIATARPDRAAPAPTATSRWPSRWRNTLSQYGFAPHRDTFTGRTVDGTAHARERRRGPARDRERQHRRSSPRATPWARRPRPRPVGHRDADGARPRPRGRDAATARVVLASTSGTQGTAGAIRLAATSRRPGRRRARARRPGQRPRSAADDPAVVHAPGGGAPGAAQHGCRRRSRPRPRCLTASPGWAGSSPTWPSRSPWDSRARSARGASRRWSSRCPGSRARRRTPSSCDPTQLTAVGRAVLDHDLGAGQRPDAAATVGLRPARRQDRARLGDLAVRAGAARPGDDDHRRRRRPRAPARPHHVALAHGGAGGGRPVRAAGRPRPAGAAGRGITVAPPGPVAAGADPAHRRGRGAARGDGARPAGGVGGRCWSWPGGCRLGPARHGAPPRGWAATARWPRCSWSCAWSRS